MPILRRPATPSGIEREHEPVRFENKPRKAVGLLVVILLHLLEVTGIQRVIAFSPFLT